MAESLDRQMRIFVDDLQIKNKSGIIIDDISNLNTGRRWELSEKIKNSLVNALEKRFIIIDRSQEMLLNREREKSVSGYIVPKADYILIGTYEVKMDKVLIRLRILVVKTSELVTSYDIQVDRESVEMYMKDYSEGELDSIIDRQNKEIKELLEKRKKENKKILKFQQIRQQKEAIFRIKKGYSMPFKERTGKLFWIGIVTAGYGFMSFSAANKIDSEGKEGAGVGRLIGAISYLASGWAFYTYFSDDGSIVMSTSPQNITLSFTKKF